jgi:hypothetical protein
MFAEIAVRKAVNAGNDVSLSDIDHAGGTFSFLLATPRPAQVATSLALNGRRLSGASRLDRTSRQGVMRAYPCFPPDRRWERGIRAYGVPNKSTWRFLSLGV